MSGGAESWLPSFIDPTDEQDLVDYEEVLFEHYLDCFVRNTARFRGKRVTVRRYPESNAKGYTFVHITTGDYGFGREPDVDRCRRLLWVKALIEAPPEDVRTWSKQEGGDVKIGIALPDFSYVVWLREDTDRVHLLTAYCTGQRKRRRLWQEWNRSEKR